MITDQMLTNQMRGGWYGYARATAIVALLLLHVCGVGADERLHGQITDDVSGQPVVSAWVRVDEEPVDDSFEAEVLTDAFGFYRTDELTAATYRVAVDHPGYLTASNSVVVSNAPPAPQSFELTPLLPGGGNDIFLEVQCVTSTIRLEGVPVEAQVFTLVGDAAPALVKAGVTDSNGVAVIQGMPNGYYRFTANQGGTARPKWLAFSSAGLPVDKTHVTKTQSVRIGLKPEPQDIVFTVRGLNPAAPDRFYDTNQPLPEVFVELTGVAFDALGRRTKLVPTRTGVTDADGEVTFRGLPAISWIAQTKKLGYWSYEAAINPHPTSGELIDTHTLRPALRSNKLWLTLEHPYADRNVLQSLKVHVQGLEGTNTEGIDFWNGWVAYYAPTFYWEWHTIQNMLPGRYKLTVNGSGAGNGKIRPLFFATDYVEIEDKTNLNANLTWTDATLALKTTPATIRGRLFAADHISELYGISEPYVSEPTPAYRQVREQQIDIEFLEYEGQTAAEGPFLKPEYRTVTVTTDTNGEFMVSLPCAFYGLRIAGMTNYWGSHVHMRNFTTTLSTEKEKVQGWPFYIWPHASFPPRNGAPDFGYPLPIRSGHDYTLDIFVRKQVMAISGAVFDDSGGDPTSGDLIMGSGTDRAQVSLQGTGGTVVKPLQKGVGSGDGKYLFIDVPPGAYSLSVAQARNTFDYGGTGTPFQVTVPAWDPPGVVPVADPEYYVLHPFGEIALANVQATYIPSTTTVELNLHQWHPIGEYYEYAGSGDYFTTKKVDYIGEVRFGGGIPQGGFTLWRPTPNIAGYGVKYFEGRVAGEGGHHTFEVYFGKGSAPDNVIDEIPPVPADIEFHVYSDADPTYFVADTTVVLESGLIYPAFPIPFDGYEVVDYEGYSVVTTVSNAYWTGIAKTTTIDPAIPKYRIDVIMTRGTRFTGTVENASSSLPISRATVEIRDRFGNVLRDGLTTTNGTFDFPAHISGSEPVYVDVTAHGYLPQRTRFAPGDGIIVPDPNDPDDKAVMTLDVELAQLPGPAVTAQALDRHGMFLPGVTRVGNTTLQTGGLATQELTMAWSVTLDASTYTYELPPFDEPDGTPPAPVSVAAVDTVTEVWLVDPRMYGVPAVGTNAAVYSNAYSAVPTAVVLPDPDDYLEVRDWLNGLGGDAAPGVFMTQADSIVPAAGPNAFTASGTLPLWKLPPGDFNPVFVVLTERGAVTLHALQYTGSLAGKELDGKQVPRWLGFAADAMGAIAGNGPVVEHVASYMPKGRFMATPSFLAEIGEEPGQPGYLRYFYRIDVNVAESMETPGEDLVGLGPGSLGLEFKAAAEVSVSGKSNSITLAIQGDAIVTNEFDVSEYAPPFLARFEPEVIITGPDAHIRSSLGKTFPGGGPFEFELTHTVWGGIKAAAELNLRPITGKLPYVGPAITTLDRTGKLSFYGDMDARIDLISRRTWRTLYPPPAGSAVGDPRVWRRHFLGGTEDLNLPAANSNSFDLAFNFGLGLRVDIGSGRAGARGGLRLAGNEHPITGRPSLVIALNPDGDWPPIKRVSGKALAELEAHLDVWVARFSKEWEWELADFDVELGTAPSISIAPIEIGFTVIDPDGFPAAAFIGLAPTLIEGLYPAGTLQMLNSGDGAMLYSDADQNDMVLRFSGRAANGEWNPPVDIVTTGGIVSAAMAERPGGGYVAVWCEIDGADVGNPYPTTTLRYATANTDGSVWSAPALLSALNGVAAELSLVRSGTFLGLVFLETEDGPTSTLYDLKSCVWNDGLATWSMPATEGSDVSIHGFDIVGGADSSPACVVLAYTSESGALQARTWDGTTMAAPVLVDSNAVGGVALEETDPEHFLLAWRPDGGGIGLKGYDKIAWVDYATPFGSTFGTDIALQRLTDGSQTNVLVSWIQGSDPAAIWTGYVGVTGEVQQAGSNLTHNSNGRYDDVQLLPGTNLDATVIARFSASPTQVREFHVSFGSGLDDDVDDDGFSDRAELRIIDFDPNDSVTTLADVAPDGDFDNDGMENAQEVAFGYDPTDSSSVLRILDFEVTDAARATIYMPERANGMLVRGDAVATLNDEPRDIVEVRTNAIGIVTLTDPAVAADQSFYGVTLER